MDRFIIDAVGPDDEALGQALAWMVRYARENGLAEGAIVVPGMQGIDSLGRVIGRDVAAFVKKNRYFTLDGLRIQVFSPRTQPRVDRFAGPVLVPWADTKMVYPW